jgi:ABC-type ATPase involved in cell division
LFETLCCVGVPKAASQQRTCATIAGVLDLSVDLTLAPRRGVSQHAHGHRRPAGTGASTLLRAIADETKPDGGQTYIGALDVTRLPHTSGAGERIHRTP